jgi:hypothetical protein
MLKEFKSVIKCHGSVIQKYDRQPIDIIKKSEKCHTVMGGGIGLFMGVYPPMTV